MNLFGKLLTAGYHLRLNAARALRYDRAPDSPEAQRLRADGVVVLPGFFPPETLRSTIVENERAFDPSRASELLFSPDGVKILEAASVSREELARFYFLHIKNYQAAFDIYGRIGPVLERILRPYYRSPYYFRDLVCYRSQPVPNENQGSYAWHRDNYPPGCLKVMVYLTDVTSEAQGPLVYALGSQAGFRPELGRYGDRVPRDQVEGRYQILPCLGPKGTVIVFNNNGIHRASNPRSGRREVINATILPRLGSRPPVEGLDLNKEAGFLKKYTR